MSMPSAGNQRPNHDPKEATRWFNQWHVHRSIVDADWMAHREIFDAAREWVLTRHPGPFTLLDLGCGDAGFIRKTFDPAGLWAYAGIDASQTALGEARDELAGARFQFQFVEADMLACLGEDSGSAGQSFGVILASYAVHHLPVREKQEFFRLAPRGSLLFADVFRRDGETRSECLEHSIGMIRRAWTGMSPEGLASTIDHVARRDFPETGKAVAAMALEAGFRQRPRELFRGTTGFHRLMAFMEEVGDSGFP